MTTAAMAKKLGRSSIMIEMDKKYCEYGQKRVDAIEYEDTPIANAVFDQKPKKVTMTEMITAGYFYVGEPFFFRNGQKVATLLEDGRLLYNEQPMDMHSCAATAREVQAKRLNGFDVWFVKRNNELVSIADIRENYRQTLN